MIFFDYACRTDSKRVVLDSEGEDYIWATLEEAARLPVDSYTRNAINEYLEKHGKRVRDKGRGSHKKVQ